MYEKKQETNFVVSQQNVSQQEKMVIDFPKPSGGYICFFLLFPIGLLLLLVAALALIYTTSGSSKALVGAGIPFALLFLGCSVIFGVLLRTGYRIKYALDTRVLQLYSGKKLAFSIPLAQVVHQQKVEHISRLLGWGTNNAGLCNRFSNGICLTIQGSRKYLLYISPSDPDKFLEQLSIAKSSSSKQ